MAVDLKIGFCVDFDDVDDFDDLCYFISNFGLILEDFFVQFSVRIFFSILVQILVEIL